jgi:very-short-patch-repair endonuclease
MRRFLSELEINTKLDRYHQGNIRIDYSTYAGKGSAARFVYQDTQEIFWAKAENVWNGHQSFKRGREVTGRKKRLSLDQVKLDVYKKHGATVQLDETTYVSSRQKARFIDSDYGEWWTQPSVVRAGCGHPSRGQHEVNFITKSEKCHATMKRNSTYRKSSDEDRCYKALCDRFGVDDVERQVRISGKRWAIDFYVKSLDIYVQLDGVYWHALNRPFEEVAKHKTKRDAQIHKKYLIDRAQDAWFKAAGKRLVRITDMEFKQMGDSVLQRIK